MAFSLHASARVNHLAFPLASPWFSVRFSYPAAINMKRSNESIEDSKNHIHDCVGVNGYYTYKEEYPVVRSLKEMPWGMRRKKIDLGQTLSTERCYSYVPAKHWKKKKVVDKTKNSNRRFVPFDICLPNVGKHEVLCPGTVQLKNYGKHGVLRPGMVLLKNYLALKDQVKIVKTCRELGVGPGGFYQPGYKDGAKLRLYMLCLGKTWDPVKMYWGEETNEDIQPPSIPQDFSDLVQKSIKEAHRLIEEELQVKDVENILPAISPDICIVNFYSETGRLGLHQDRDESRKSIEKGLPVVSFSIGDSAEFLYGVQRDVHKAEKVVLESGDVLIFGGESRNIYHGVTSIIANTAPTELLKETDLRPGRLNLTFRQY